MNFIEAVQGIKGGKKVYMKSWTDGYIFLYKKHGYDDGFMWDNGLGEFIPDMTGILATNWEFYNGGPNE